MSKHQDLNQATYNAIALKYEKTYGQIPAAITFAKKLVKILRIQEEPSILDLGCGSGSILKIFEEQFPSATLTGVDFSSELLKLAKNKLRRTQLIEQDLLSFNSDQKFDLIIATFSLIHLTNEELRSVSIRINNMLKPNGYLYLAFILGQEEKIVQEALDPTKQVYFNYHSQGEIFELFSPKDYMTLELLIDVVKDEYESEQDLYLILKKIDRKD